MASFVLQKVLAKKGITQYRLAKSLNVSVGEVYRWCQEDYNPTLRTLARLATHLDVPISALIEAPEKRHG